MCNMYVCLCCYHYTCSNNEGVESVCPWSLNQAWGTYCRVFTPPSIAVFIAAQFFTIVLLLANLNSCTNPWIYMAFSDTICKGLNTLIASLCGWRAASYCPCVGGNSVPNRCAYTPASLTSSTRVTCTASKVWIVTYSDWCLNRELKSVYTVHAMTCRL